MPPATKRKPRTYDPKKTWDALNGQLQAVRSLAAGLGDASLALPSGLPGWDVRTLLAHIARQADAVPRLLAEPAPARGTAVTDLNSWATLTSSIADRIDTETHEVVAAAPDVVAELDAVAGRLAACREEALRADRIVPHAFGAMRALDFTVTRLVELAVHSDDLARATGVEVALNRHALAGAVRLLADALAAKAPGGAVEVRIPPYAVVQCIEGPRHTRGTPPNVVETGPLTWLRLATGRTTWGDALDAAAVSASGERADLGAVLPVLG
ncbi:maleylpyruvate isomerase family mycothiol-dependent enzyme [Streptomyces sp. A7024]|uniref:Maleylpyruvate isomerase family mycothiol-dependent enzyme n=1 Tax=Streptomyces coryli TaxID=1128680 RepID=A0A6G4U0V3_9ACTN|nr:maleylpyruvate isomerase family mycothiol-dependent enzyme [Streptomyces coryli]NGN65336.1 maleylpyruvate isomerase family mycothiol-dependent enzyme [Streptomyces coryli]